MIPILRGPSPIAFLPDLKLGFLEISPDYDSTHREMLEKYKNHDFKGTVSP